MPPFKMPEEIASAFRRQRDVEDHAGAQSNITLAIVSAIRESRLQVIHLHRA